MAKSSHAKSFKEEAEQAAEAERAIQKEILTGMAGLPRLGRRLIRRAKLS